MQQLRTWYEGQHREASSAAEFWALCQQRDEYRSEYLRYWNSTKNLTKTGRPVDGVILPVAPSAAVAENHFTYYGASLSRTARLSPFLTLTSRLQPTLRLQMCSIIPLAASLSPLLMAP